MNKARPLIGKKIKAHRLAQGMKLKELSERMGYPRSDYLSQIEHGKRPITNEQILNILIRGFHLRPQQAQEALGKWIIEDAANQYGLKVTIHS
jgi:transcriptional regulator with XRE-family HTH domain